MQTKKKGELCSNTAKCNGMYLLRFAVPCIVRSESAYQRNKRLLFEQFRQVNYCARLTQISVLQASLRVHV